MHMQGNTILITGGGSGIGRALAEAFHARGNTVIITGRRAALLEEVTAANPGIHAEVLDVTDAAAITAFADKVRSDWPALNVVIHNAGIMVRETIRDGTSDLADKTVLTNLLGPIRLNAALLPGILTQPHGAVMTVSSGLAFVPLALYPTYCATKAAIHSYTQSLRIQLRDTAVEVFEIAPPYVQTELTGPAQAVDPNAMPLAQFTGEVMEILATGPKLGEVCVGRVMPLRGAEASGSYDGVLRQMNGLPAAG